MRFRHNLQGSLQRFVAPAAGDAGRVVTTARAFSTALNAVAARPAPAAAPLPCATAGAVVAGIGTSRSSSRAPVLPASSRLLAPLGSGTAAAASGSTSRLSGQWGFLTQHHHQQTRNYRHWHAPAVDDFTLPPHSMPIDIKEILKDPSKREFDFLDHYWYWRIRKESTILHPERLVTLTYKQLAYDMGMPVVSEVLEHHMGLIELYEYLKSSPMIGPFGTVENPVIIPSLSDIRQVCCTGGTGDNEHDAMFFHMREGFLYRCGECDQIFMLVRVTYGNSWVDESYKDHKEIFAKDPDVDDVFDIKLLERGHRSWNSSDMLRWEMGAQALNAVPTPEDATEMKMPVIREVDLSIDSTKQISK